MITDWIDGIINGVGGLKDYHRYEMGGSEPTTKDAAVWAIKFLANPDCEGSKEVLNAIIQRRNDLIAKDAA